MPASHHARTRGAPRALERETAVRVVAAGKAAVGMAAAAESVLGRRLADGIMTVPAVLDSGSPWRAFPATHPQPAEASEAAGRAALALADTRAPAAGLLLVCLSGGASAMLAVPAAGLTIADKANTTAGLLKAGLDIAELNVVRRHLSLIKGGQLAARAGRSMTLAISDVCTPVEDDPVVIGSGPTVGDSSSFDDALAVIRRHGLEGEIPAGGPSSPRGGRARRSSGPRAAWRSSAPTECLLARRLAPRRDEGGAATAARLGYHVHVEPLPIVGEARLAAASLLTRARTLPRPACAISSGETTVLVRGQGRGGRNQELALASLAGIAEAGPAAMASMGTDGVDGPTDAAGAFVDSGMWAELGRRPPRLSTMPSRATMPIRCWTGSARSCAPARRARMSGTCRSSCSTSDLRHQAL